MSLKPKPKYKPRKRKHTSYVDAAWISVTWTEPVPVTEGVGDGLAFTDPSDTKYPTSTTVITAGWNNPTEAYSSNNDRMDSSTYSSEQEFSGYGWNIPAGSTINSCYTYYEGYVTDPINEDVAALEWVEWYWYGHDLNFTTSEETRQFNMTSQLNTPERVNTYKNRISRTYTSGGCFHPQSQVLIAKISEAELETLVGLKPNWLWESGFWKKAFDKTKLLGTELFELKPVDTLTGNENVFGCEVVERSTGLVVTQELLKQKWDRIVDLYLKPIKIKSFQAHEGTWDMVHAYFEIDPSILKVYDAHPHLKSLFNITQTEQAIIGDVAATSNHPVSLRNRPRTTFGDLRIGDKLNEILWENGRWFTKSAPIMQVEHVPYEGKVYDVKIGDGEHLFFRHLIGHLSKV